jgi:hypothetical protein
LFNTLNLSITEDYLEYLKPLLLSNEVEDLRQITARAITAALVQFPETFTNTQRGKIKYFFSFFVVFFYFYSI